MASNNIQIFSGAAASLDDENGSDALKTAAAVVGAAGSAVTAAVTVITNIL